MGKPWSAYSWLFEILIFGLYSRLGLVGLFVYVYLLLLSITVALHSLVREFEPRTAQSVALTAAALIAMVSLRTPRPWLFTILFFIIELKILVKVRCTGNYRWLLLLPPLFAIWANLHIQFIYGLFVLGVAAMEQPFSRLLPRLKDVGEGVDQPLLFSPIVSITVACIVATFLNPYHLRIYWIVLDTIREGGFYDLITELQALRFRAFPDWIVLGLTLAAAFVFGRGRSLSLFWVTLFLAGVYLSFRSGRDLWFVTIVATAIIARSQQRVHGDVARATTTGEVLLVLILTIVITGVAIRVNGVSNSNLQKAVAQNFPVDAATFIEGNGISGRLYNPFNWGGYLIWRLPNLPVSIDGRGNLHNPDRLSRTVRVWKGEPDWFFDPELNASSLVVAPRNAALTQLLRLDTRWQLIYEDSVALVFVAR